ncbi:MAG: ATP synthase F1 subunit delta [Caedimonadaceae bacterium]|nr:MAG: ATP synthase F1 subunit delta [Caedimonadaceae bacterium]
MRALLDQGRLIRILKEPEVSRILDRYAKALFGLAEKSKQMPAILHDLKTLVQLLKTHAILARVMTSPITQISELNAIIEDLAQKMAFDNLTVRFLQTLANERRLALLEPLIHSLETLLQRMQNQLEVVVVSANPLSKETQQSLEKMLSKKLDKKIAMRHAIDPSLIGGFKLEIGSYEIDLSIAAHLSQLRTQLQG